MCFLSSKTASTENEMEQDGSGWTPLMMAASLKDGDAIVDMLLSKGADVNTKSK